MLTWRHPLLPPSPSFSKQIIKNICLKDKIFFSIHNFVIIYHIATYRFKKLGLGSIV